MNKIYFYALSFILFMSMPVSAARYIITKLKPASTIIRIGQQHCTVGSEFDDKDTIFWNNADTLFMNVICSSGDCDVPKYTLYYPHNLLDSETCNSLHNFLFAQTQYLVGYNHTHSHDTMIVFPNGSTFMHLSTQDFGELYVHTVNQDMNYTYELEAENNLYFISFDDFKEHSKPIEIKITTSPNLLAGDNVKTIVVAFGLSNNSSDYLAETEYYQKKADGYRKEAEYYQKKAYGYEREAEYYIKKAESHQREAAYYSKKGDMDRANTQTRYAREAMDKAKTQQRYAKDAWDNYRTQLRYAEEADEKAAMYLKWATQ